jgi:hypothetical protein
MDNDGEDEANGIEIGVFLLLGFTLIAGCVCYIVPLLNLYKWRRMEKIGVPTVFKVTSGRSGYSHNMFVGNKVAHYVTVVLVPTTGESTIKEKEYMVGKEEYDEALLAGQITMLVDSCTGFAYPEKTVLTQVIIEEARLTGQITEQKYLLHQISSDTTLNTATYHRASGCAICLYVMRNGYMGVFVGVLGFSTLIPNVLLLVASPRETWLVAAATVGGILVVVAALKWLFQILWNGTLIRSFRYPEEYRARSPQQQEVPIVMASSPSPDNAYSRMPPIH